MMEWYVTFTILVACSVILHTSGCEGHDGHEGHEESHDGCDNDDDCANEHQGDYEEYQYEGTGRFRDSDS